MHRFLLFLLVSLILFLFTSHVLVNAQAPTFTISQPDQTVIPHPFKGFGVEWDPFFFNWFHQEYYKAQYGETAYRQAMETDWQLITSRLKEMEIPLIRVWTQLYFAKGWDQTPPTKTWDYSSDRMVSLFRTLDFACQNNIDVILTDWAWSFWPSYQLYNPPPPIDPAYATDVVDNLYELIHNRGYSCIKYLIVGNEPDYEIMPGLDLNTYSAMINSIKTNLVSYNLNDQVKLIGPDAACCQDFFSNAVAANHDAFDVFDFHLYSYVNPTQSATFWYELDKRRDWVAEVTANDPLQINKPMLITEAGNDGNKDSWDYAIHMADYGTTLLTTRLQGALAWNLYDDYYDQGHTPQENNDLIPWGMWQFKSGNWALRPWSQTWGLLVKFAPPGSHQAPVNGTPPITPPNSPYRVGALKRPDGGWNIFLVNRAQTAAALNLTLPELGPVTFDRYQVTSTTLTTYPNTLIIPPLGQLNFNQTLSLTLPANSFTVLVQPPTPPFTGFDGDNDVDWLDLQILTSHFNQFAAQYSLLGTGLVDIFDFNSLVTRLTD